MTANNKSSKNNGQEEYLNIVEQNNLGVIHLMNGNFNDANRCLRSAFEMVRKHVLVNGQQNKNKITSSLASQQQQQQQQRQRPQQNIASSTTKPRCSELQRQRQQQQQRQQYIDILKATATTNDGNYNNNNRNCCSRTTTTRKGFMIYSSAFVNNEDDDDNQNQWSIVSAYIVFNLGLLFYAHAQQQQQQQQGQRRYNDLQNAVKIFENALKLLVDQNCQNHNNTSSSSSSSSVFLKRATGNPLIDLFYMTLLTKLGQVHYDLLLTRKAHRFQYKLSEMVHQFISFSPQSSLDDNVLNGDQQQQYHLLLLQQQQQRSLSLRCSTSSRVLYRDNDFELKYLLRVNGMNLLLELDNHIMMNNNNNRQQQQQNQSQAQVELLDHSSSTVATSTRTPSNYNHGAPAA